MADLASKGGRINCYRWHPSLFEGSDRERILTDHGTTRRGEFLPRHAINPPFHFRISYLEMSIFLDASRRQGDIGPMIKGIFDSTFVPRLELEPKTLFQV